MNAIAHIPSSQAQRRERRPQKCERLADLGMELAEAAQREALRELQPRPERRPLPPGQYLPPSQPPARDATPAELFDTFSRCVRQAILLEARLDSGAYDHPPPSRATPHDPAPRSSARSQAKSPGDGTSLYYERLEDDLAADAQRHPDEILGEIHEQLGKTTERLAPVAPVAARPNARQTAAATKLEPIRPVTSILPDRKPPPKPG